MCDRTKAVVHCQLGDLKPGQRLLDEQQDRQELMVTNAISVRGDTTTVVNLRTGVESELPKSVKLAKRDWDGRLYISRRLNPELDPAKAAPDAVVVLIAPTPDGDDSVPF